MNLLLGWGVQMLMPTLVHILLRVPDRDSLPANRGERSNISDVSLRTHYFSLMGIGEHFLLLHTPGLSVFIQMCVECEDQRDWIPQSLTSLKGFYLLSRTVRYCDSLPRV